MPQRRSLASQSEPPTRLKIGVHDYTVSFDADEIQRLSNARGQSLNGQCDRDQLRISIDPVRPTSTLRETLLHEALHAIVGFTGQNQEWPDNEEGLIRAITPILLGAMRDNPEFMRYLLAE